MGDDWEQDTGKGSDQPNFDDIDKRIEELKRTVIQGANEAQQRVKRVVDKANEYLQQAKIMPEPQTPREPSSVEEQRIRNLANIWSNGNWRVARDLGTYMDVILWSEDEVWEATVQTRWETRNIEIASEPYTGRAPVSPQPFLPVWDYQLPEVTGLKAPPSRIPLNDLDEVLSCTACNGTGHLLCATCTGRGWIVCPDCQGRTRIRCSTCHGRGYVADWKESGRTGKKPFFQKQADHLVNSVNEKVSDVFEGIRQQGVPIPNPLDTDPANKGRTVPCPDCVNGEVDCTCGTGKRVCPNCQGAKTAFCAHCGGTGKVVRHRTIVRQFDLRLQTQLVGNNPIPEQRLLNVTGELIYNAEVDETLYAEAPPEEVPMDVWQVAVQMVKSAAATGPFTGKEGPAAANPTTNQQPSSRATLQVLELIRIPYTRVDYRYSGQDYTFYVYDIEGREKFYAERFPARWDGIERLFRTITNDLMPSSSESTPSNPANSQERGYRVPVEKPPYSITEEDQ